MKSRYPIVIYVLLNVFFIGCATTRSPLINAAHIGDVNSIKNLCNVNEQDKYGQTPLIHSISKKKSDAARFLIESGADIKIKDAEGFDALLWAAHYGNLEIIDLLLGKGADIESQDSSGETPLMCAVSNGNLEVINLLLDRGANIESRDFQGWTPIKLTVSASNSVNTARLLIKRGANLNAKNKESKTPLVLAMQYGNYDLADELKKEVSRRSDDSLIAKIIFIRESDQWWPFRQDPHIYIGDHLILLKKIVQTLLMSSPENVK